MNIDQTLKLIDAGFTRDEILAMSTAPAPEPAKPAAPAAADSAPAKAPETVPADAAKPQPAPAPEAKAEAKPAPATDQNADAQRILAALGKLAEGVAVPPENNVSFEQRLANSILAGMGIKSKED